MRSRVKPTNVKIHNGSERKKKKTKPHTKKKSPAKQILLKTKTEANKSQENEANKIILKEV